METLSSPTRHEAKPKRSNKKADSGGDRLCTFSTVGSGVLPAARVDCAALELRPFGYDFFSPSVEGNDYDLGRLFEVKADANDIREASSASTLPTPNHQGDEWKLVQRIVATPPFLRSAFLTNFLVYICDRKLRDRENEITEHQIGVHALGRPAAYHQGEDNVVRNYARMLRKRLEEYFAEEGRSETLRIVIPRGQYVPVFETNSPAEATIDAACTETAAEPSPDLIAPAPARRSSFSTRVKIATLVIALCLPAGWVFWLRHAQPVSLYPSFWREVFNSGRTTYIVTADGGIELLEDMTGKEVHLPEYVNGDLDKWFPDIEALKRSDGTYFDADHFSNYTSVADLNAVVGFLSLPETAAGHIVVRNARDMHMNDLLQSNVILLGGPHADPWVELFEPGSAFHINFSARVDGRSIVDKHPRPGEQAEYHNVSDGNPRITYAIVSFLPSVDGEGHALVIQGLNMAGTQAGVNFVLDPSAMAPILAKARMKDGSIGRFEVVLQTQAVGASAPAAHPVVERYGSADPESDLK